MGNQYFNLADYIDVQDRINRFWGENPEGAIITELMSDPMDWNTCRYKATVWKNLTDVKASATGFAFEHVGPAGANKTSHEENCETSAIGRALANMGYAKSRDERPSRQEMAKVNAGREQPPAAYANVTPMHAPAPSPEAPRPTITNPDLPASEKQLTFARGLAKAYGFKGPDGHTDEDALYAALGARFEVEWPNITKGEATQIIDALKAGQIKGPHQPDPH